jgi:hypothetical protein
MIGAMDDPMLTLHQCPKRVLVGIEHVGLDTNALERVHDILDVVEPEV